eukprot:2454036-Pyramimonas_sp.AAC.1
MATHAMLGVYRQCWVQRGPALLMHSDGEGAVSNDTAEASLNPEGAELRARARRRIRPPADRARKPADGRGEQIFAEGVLCSF